MSCDRPQELSPRWVLRWTRIVWSMLAATTCIFWTWEISAVHLPSLRNSRLVIKSNKLRLLCSRKVLNRRNRHKASRENRMLLGKSDTNKDNEQFISGTLFIDDLSRCFCVQILNKPNFGETSLRYRCRHSWIERSRIRLTKTLLILYTIRYITSYYTTELQQT